MRVQVTTLHVEVSEPHSFRTLRLGPAAPLAPQHWEALGVLGPWLTHLSFTGGAGAPYETNPVWPESVEQHAAAAAATRETRMGALAGLELPRLTRLTLVTGMSPLASLAFTAAPGQLPALTHLNIDVGNVMGLGLVIESLDLASRAALQELELKGAIALRPSEAGGTSCAALRLPPSCVARLRIDWGMMNRVPVKCTLENVCGSFPAPAGSLFDTEAAKEALECAVRGCAKEVFSLVFEYLFDTCDDQKRENRCPGDLMEECGFADSAYHDVFEGYEFSNYPQTMDGFLDWVDALLEDAKPGRGASSANAGAESPSQLTVAIKGCTSPDTLLALVDQHGQAFNYIHAAAVLSHAAQLCADQKCTIPHRGIERMVQLAREHLPSMGERQLANTAWAVAKLQHTDDTFMAALIKAASPQLHNFNPQNLANTVWALATLGHADGAFMAALLEAATPQLRNFKPQHLANTAWALAKLQHIDGAFMATLLKALANTAWALATLGHVDGAFMAALIKAATPHLCNFNPQNLANTVWGLATLGHVDGVFMAALLKAAAPQLLDFTPQALSNTAWALATMDHYDRAFVAELLKAAAPQPHSFNPQNLTNTAWALAMLGHADGAFMATLLQQAAGMVLDSKFKDLQQLFLCMLWLGDQHSAVVVPAKLGAVSRRAWMEERANARPTRVQLEVLAAVRQLPGCSGATSEQATDDGLFRFDIAVQLLDDSRLAVEVDGPQHFMSSPPDRLGGVTLLRNQLLEARGWRVVSVPVVTGWVRAAKEDQHGIV
ncbi:hypothetical protein FOA52_011709 [Chlamydomonas sp. UWO 241]|nr:hypothetical protein FOA52_011709 [Chlamydomonas sp. UWO 241]